MYKLLVLMLGIAIGICGCTAKSSTELYADGVNKLREKNPNAAIILFKSALEKDQNFLDARYQLAKAYLSTGKYEQAEKEFQKVVRLNPTLPDIKLDLAKLYNCLKKPDQAISLAEEYLVSKPDSADALEAIGSGYALKKMPREAEASFLSALQKEPGRLSTKLELAALMAPNQDKAEQAKGLLREVIMGDPHNPRPYYLLAQIELSLGRREQALVLYKRLADINANDQVAQYKAGLVNLELGNVAAAETTAGELIKKFPNKSEGYRLKGIVSYQRKNFPEAINALQNAVKLHPNLEGYYFLGLSLFNQGELENALSQFRQILDKVPAFQQARLVTGIILLKQNRLDDAISEMTRLVEADGKNALAHNILGSAYMAKGMYEQGMQELDTATELDPKLVDAHLRKGLFRLSQGRNSEVETELATAVRVAPEILNTRLILASFYQHRNNYAKALATLKEGLTGKKEDALLYAGMARLMFAGNRPAEAIRFLQQSKQINPRLVGPFFTLADYYVGNGDVDKALSEYSAVLNIEPANIKEMVRMAALLESAGRENEAMTFYLKAKETRDPMAYLALAGHFERKADLVGAISVLDEAVRYVPRSPIILEKKAHLCLKGKQYKKALKISYDIATISPERGITLKVTTLLAMNDLHEAKKCAQQAIALKPDSSSGNLLLASVYQAQNDPKRAIAEVQKGLARDSGNLQTALVLAELHAKAGNYSQAIATCDDILRKRPDFAPAYFAQGTFYAAQGNKKKAINKYRAALAISANFTAALNNLAYLYADGKGNGEEAVQLAKNALSLEPHNSGIMDTLGYAYLNNGQLQEARGILEKTSALLPDNPTVHYHLALVHRAQGENRQAVAQLQQALRSGDFPESHLAKNLMTELNGR